MLIELPLSVKEIYGIILLEPILFSVVLLCEDELIFFAWQVKKIIGIASLTRLKKEFILQKMKQIGD